MKKLIYCLPLLLIFIASYSRYNKNYEKFSVPGNKAIELKTNSAKQFILDIPWIDPSLRPPKEGC